MDKIKGIRELGIMLDLYFSKYNYKKPSFATLTTIAKELGDGGHTKAVILKLNKKGILKKSGEWVDINSKLYETYTLDREKFLEYIKQDEIFEKIYLMVWKIYLKEGDVFGNFPEMYDKARMKEKTKNL